MNEVINIQQKINDYTTSIKVDESVKKFDIANKREFIEKTLQWLKSHIEFETRTYSDIWDVSIVDILAMDFSTVDEMEESFRKIMEE